MKISIIVPIYNAEKYLDRCIESILNQTYKNLEIILVDDGSTDSSRMICDYYKDKDNRIKAVYQNNKGVSAARNAGIQNATGNYIGFVDSDDYIQPDMYDTLHNLFNKFNCDIAISGYSCIYSASIIRSDHLDRTLSINPQNLLEEVFMGSIKGFLWNKLFKAELFKNLSIPENIHYGEDLFILSKIIYLHSDLKCAYTSKSLYNYVQVSDSITNDISKSFNPDDSLKFEKTLDNIKELYLENEKVIELINLAKTQSFLDVFRLALLNGYSRKFEKKRYMYVRDKLVGHYKGYIKNKNIQVKHKFLYLLAIISPSLLRVIYTRKLYRAQLDQTIL